MFLCPFLRDEVECMYKKYLTAINELINVVLKLKDSDEIRRIATSDESRTETHIIR